MFASIQKKEPYVSWKNNSKLVGIPTLSRPIQSNSIQLGNDFRARPLKQWRKQLIPEPNSGSGVSSITVENRPSISIESDLICKSLDGTSAKGIIGTFGSNDIPRPCDDLCNAEKHVIKSARVSLIDNSYINTSSYMESKCMLYNQKLSTTPIEGNQYFNQDMNSIMWPSDNSKGSQCRSSIDCSNEKCNVAIYKPNNDQFANQGAVDSSSRISRLKYNTVYENGSSLNSAWGALAANKGKYITSNNGPYYDKYKIQVCK